MAQEWQQTGLNSVNIGLGFSGVKCDTTTIATNPLQKTCELSGSGGLEVTVTLPAKAQYTAAIFAADEAVGVTSIPSGTWNVKVNVTSAASSGSQIREVHICRVNSSGTSQATIASSTGLAIDAAVTGVKSIDVTQGSAHGCSATDHFYIQVVVYSNSHGGTTIGITPDQLITDTITATQTWGLAGDIVGQSTFTGDAVIDHAVWSLEGDIVGASTFTGNLGAPITKHILVGDIVGQGAFAGDIKPKRKLAGSIISQAAVVGAIVLTQAVVGAVSGQSTFTGDLKGNRQLAGSVASASTFTGDLKVTRELAGTIAGASTFIGDLGEPFTGATTWDLEGDIVGQSTFAGTFAPQTLAGAVAGASTFIGDLGEPFTSQQLGGAIAGQSAFTGDAVVTRKLVGHVAGQSTIVGDLKRDVKLAGGIAATSTLTGDLVIGFTPDDIPQAEADALVYLYQQTTGWGWTDSTNWLSDNTVGNWFGITVVGGHVTRVELDSNNLVGNIDDFQPNDLPSLERLALYQNASLTGSVTNWTIPSSVEWLLLGVSGLGGDCTNWAIPSGIVYLKFYQTNITGNVDGWTIGAACLQFTRYETDVTGVADISEAVVLDEYHVRNCGLTQTEIDAIIQSVYDNRDDFTSGSPTLYIDGTSSRNSRPSGIYQDGNPPTTGLEWVYELVNDPQTEGFQVWTILYNATIAIYELAGAIDAQSTLTGDLVIPEVFPSGWAHKVAITIDKDDISADLDDWTMAFDQSFSSVLTQADGPLDADGAAAALDGGGDIRFSSDEAGTTRLACDIRNFETDNTPANATCEIAVKIAFVSSTADTVIWMWWGKTGETQPAAAETYGQHAAYDSDHAAAWNFRDWVDRTENEYDADTTTAGDPAVGQTGGPVGQHAYFDGDDIRSTSSSITHGIGTGDFAFEVVVARVSDTGIWDAMLGSGTYDPAIYVENGGGQWSFNWASSGSSASEAWPAGTDFHHIVIHRTGTAGVFRRDGSFLYTNTTAFATTCPNNVMHFGSGYANTGECADVQIAEFRLHTDIRSDAWWDANYANLFNTSGFLTFGEIDAGETALAGAITGQSTFAGNLKRDVKIAGAIAAQSTLTGDLVISSVTWELAGAVAGQSTFAGDLKPQRELAGAIAGTSSFVGDLKVDRQLAGAIGGTSTFAGDLKVTRNLAGTVAGQSTFTGDLKGQRKLAGSITGQSTFVGDLVVSGVEILAGDIVGQSTFAGDLKPQRELDGTIAGQSTFAGDLKRDVRLVGAVAGQSTFAGDLTVDRQLAGAISGASTFAGDLKVIRGLAGSVVGQSTFAGDLKAQRLLAGSIVGQSTLTGDLAPQRQLAGSIDGQSTLTGTLIQTHRLIGAIAAQSTFAGELIVEGAALPLVGHITAVSTLAGDLKRDVKLAGGIAAQSTFAGDLKGQRVLAGSIVGQSTFTGDLVPLEAAWVLDGDIAGQSTFAGDLKPQRKLAGTVAAQSTLLGDLTILEATWPLQGAVAGQSTVAGDLKPQRKLAGSIDAQSTVLGDLTLLQGVWVLTGEIAGTSTFSGTITQTHSLSGSIAGTSTFAGDLKGKRVLAGSIAGQSTFVGDLAIVEAAWSLQGAVVGQSTLSGTLHGTLRLVGPIEAQSTFAGAITQQMVLVETIAAQSTFTGSLRWLPLGAWPLEGSIAGQSDFRGIISSVYHGKTDGSVGTGKVGGTVGSNRVGGTIEGSGGGSVV